MGKTLMLAHTDTQEQVIDLFVDRAKIGALTGGVGGSDYETFRWVFCPNPHMAGVFGVSPFETEDLRSAFDRVYDQVADHVVPRGYSLVWSAYTVEEATVLRG